MSYQGYQWCSSLTLVWLAVFHIVLVICGVAKNGIVGALRGCVEAVLVLSANLHNDQVDPRYMPIKRETAILEAHFFIIPYLLMFLIGAVLWERLKERNQPRNKTRGLITHYAWYLVSFGVVLFSVFSRL